MSILSRILGLFSATKLGDTALNLVERFANQDMTAGEKAQFLLDWAKATAHQSPVRRFIAFSMVCLWLLLAGWWLVNMTIGYYLDLEAGTAVAGLTMVFMKEQLQQPMNIIVGFYFASHLLSGIKK